MVFEHGEMSTVVMPFMYVRSIVHMRV